MIPKILSKFLTREEQKKLKKEAMPAFIPVMLAKLTHHPFSRPDWIYERKFDGERCLVFKRGTKITLKSRNDKNINAQFPELVKAFSKMDAPDFVIDGEVCAMKGSATSFERLQKRLGLTNPEQALATGFPVRIYVFDMLYLDGYDITKLPLLARKKLLKEFVPFKKPIFYSVHWLNDGVKYWHAACKKKWEGIMAKKSDSTYVHVRSPYWLKFKCTDEQELVIAGYTDPQHSRVGFGSLLLGYYKKGELHYAGNVGTGFNDEFLETFGKKLQKIEIKKNPFVSAKKLDGKNIHFVKPQYVGEVGFSEWTRDNKLRHPRFLGLRYDKAAKDVTQESTAQLIPQTVLKKILKK